MIIYLGLINLQNVHIFEVTNLELALQVPKVIYQGVFELMDRQLHRQANRTRIQ